MDKKETMVMMVMTIVVTMEKLWSMIPRPNSTRGAGYSCREGGRRCFLVYGIFRILSDWIRTLAM
jgi:hypothetical protein